MRPLSQGKDRFEMYPWPEGGASLWTICDYAVDRHNIIATWFITGRLLNPIVVK